eukprot:718096-Alexandrium_andersonii.AAC.1
MSTLPPRGFGCLAGGPGDPSRPALPRLGDGVRLDFLVFRFLGRSRSRGAPSDGVAVLPRTSAFWASRS